MSLLEHVTKLADQHPKVVISSLLGLLLVGGVGGGVWINGLKANLDQLSADLRERDSVFAERMSLVEQRHDNVMDALWQKDAVVSKQVEILTTEIPDFAASIDRVAQTLGQLGHASMTQNQNAALLAAVDSLTFQSAALRTALARVQAAEEMGDQLIRISDRDAAGGPRPPMSSAGSPFLLLLLMLAWLGVAYATVSWYRRRRPPQRPVH
jgi:hypothetical protein